MERWTHHFLPLSLAPLCQLTLRSSNLVPPPRNTKIVVEISLVVDTKEYISFNLLTVCAKKYYPVFGYDLLSCPTMLSSFVVISSAEYASPDTIEMQRLDQVEESLGILRACDWT